MGKSLFWWEAGAAAFTAVLGTILHFTYGWSGGKAAVGAFSAVNESVWEHMKLLFVPMFLEGLVQLAVLGRQYPNLAAVRAAAVLTGLVLIPVVFYTYTGVLGAHLLWVDIGLFYLAVAGAFLLEYRLLRQGSLTGPRLQLAGLLLLWGLAAAFVWWTFDPPRLALWQDQSTGQFGI